MTAQHPSQEAIVPAVVSGGNVADPLGDSKRLEDAGTKKNHAKVGSARPSSLLYTYGPGAIMDLPHFTVMPAGYDDWEHVWSRRHGNRIVSAPRLLDAVRVLLGREVKELRPFPWQPKEHQRDNTGKDLGVPARVFPQWLRCTGCDRLAPLDVFDYVNTQPYRPDQAEFRHLKCPGRRADRGRAARGSAKTGSKSMAWRGAVPARYLLACANGHLDEFPYDLWVHEGLECAEGVPRLYLEDFAGGRGAMASVRCASCGASRGMNEAQGEVGRTKLPKCRGRHPHLDTFTSGCPAETRLMLVGASNLWFPALQSIVVMPSSTAESTATLAEALRDKLGEDLKTFADQLVVVRALAKQAKISGLPESDTALAEIVAAALQPPTPQADFDARRDTWEPVDLLVPEWCYLLKDPLSAHHLDEDSGLVLDARKRGDQLPKQISRVLAVERLRKVNALLGFTRIDEMERADNLPTRLVPLTTKRAPTWTVVTEDLGEGIFVQLDEGAVTDWEARVLASAEWAAHREAHRRNYLRRFSETAKEVDPDDRLPTPRYWLVHTFAHLLIRELAMSSGYGAASISERVYAWPADEAKDRTAAAGVLLLTTASDSDGTLGGLVSLSEPTRLQDIVTQALSRARRCSSDPVCASRVPKDPEDFLHGAACHACVMASETSCERANRFLDRRFVVNLPGPKLGFF